MIAGRYELGAKLGEGSYGAVYRARDLRGGAEVAVKLRSPGRGENISIPQILAEETNILRRIDHPNVMKVLDAGEDAGRAFVVMPLLGKSLHEHLAKGSLSATEIVEVHMQVAEALAALHTRGVIHRDLKPKNVALDRRPKGRLHATLIDFGFAADIPEAGALQADKIEGTSEYIAPERAQQRLGAIDGRSDLYALGVMLFRSLTGQWPFATEDRTPGREILTGGDEMIPRPRARALRPDTSFRLNELVVRLLAARPARRPSSAGVTQALLEAARSELLPRAAAGSRRQEREVDSAEAFNALLAGLEEKLPRVAEAEWLLDRGLARVAGAQLASLPGAAAQATRQRVSEASPQLRRGIYALVGKTGQVALWPVEARLAGSADPEDFEAARLLAARSVRALLTAPGLEAPHFWHARPLAEYPERVSLALALADLAHALRTEPVRPVVAIGEVDFRGRVLAVEGDEGLVLEAAPDTAGAMVLGGALGLSRRTYKTGVQRVATLEEAARLAFGEAALIPSHSYIGVPEFVRRLVSLPPGEARTRLDELAKLDISETDHCRVLIATAGQLRRLGHSAEARTRLEGLLVLCQRDVGRLGEEALEEVQLQHLLTYLDHYEFEEGIRLLEARLLGSFSSTRTKVAVQGALAQALSMSGLYEDAVRCRTKNVELHAEGGPLLRPAFTFSQLALDLARLGREEPYREAVESLYANTDSGDEMQLRYNALAFVRGLVLLGHFTEALAWARGGVAGPLRPRNADSWLNGAGPISEHPEDGIARALGRALRKTGEGQAARLLLARVNTDYPELRGFVTALARLEMVLAMTDNRDTAAAHERVLTVSLLREKQPKAAAFHKGLASRDWAAIEAALDRVWY